MTNPDPLRERLNNLRKNPDQTTDQKSFILDTLQNDDINEVSRSIAMAIVADRGWIEGLPFAKRIVSNSPNYSGLQQAAIRAIGILGQDKHDLAFLEELLEALENSKARGIMGLINHMTDTLRKASNVLRTKLNLPEDRHSKSAKSRSSICCTEEEQRKWRKMVVQADGQLPEALAEMATTFEDRNCKRLLQQTYLLMTRHNIIHSNDRKGKLSQEDVTNAIIKITEAALVVIEECRD